MCVTSGNAPKEGVKRLLLIRKNSVRMMGNLDSLMECVHARQKDKEWKKKTGQEDMVELRVKVVWQGEVHPKGIILV